MNGVLLFLIMLSIIVVAVAGFLLGRQRGSICFPQTRSSRETALPYLSDRVPEVLFTSRDLEYVRQQSSAELLTFFRDERKKLALLWLTEVRSQATTARMRHAESVRADARLEPGVELKIAVRYWSLSVTCAIALCMVHLFGPFKFRAFIRQSNRLSHELVGIVAGAGSPFTETPATSASKERQT